MSELTKAGDALASIAFNLAQKCGHTLTSDNCQLLDKRRKEYDASRSAILRLEATLAKYEKLDAYDAGYLNDYGGGNVSWWHDYIRAELDRAHDFYVAQIKELEQ